MPYFGLGTVTLEKRATLWSGGLNRTRLFYLSHAKASLRTILAKKENAGFHASIRPPIWPSKIDITNGCSVERLPIYATLGVPEIWQLDDEKLHVLCLQDDGQYLSVDASPTFPMLPLAGLVPFLEEAGNFAVGNELIRRLLS